MTPTSKTPPAPTLHDVGRMIGSTQPLWDDIQRQLRTAFEPLTEEWVFGGTKRGWALRFKYKQRAILYLKPLDQYFRASLALGPKAVAATHASALSASLRELIDTAEVFPEGKAVRVEVRSVDDVRLVEQLVQIKMRG